MEERVELSGWLRGPRSDEGFVEVEEFGLGDGQLVVQDIEELPLHPSDVLDSKNAGGIGPTDIFQRRIVRILQLQRLAHSDRRNEGSTNLMSQDEGTEENTMKSPFFGLDGQMGPCPPHVDEGDEDIGDAHFGGVQYPLDELCEFLVLGGTGGRTSPRSGGETENVVDSVSGLFYNRGYGENAS